MQSAFSRIWTRFTVSISDEGNHNTTGTPRIDEFNFLPINPHCCVQESKGERRLWVRFYFFSALYFLYVLDNL